MTDKFKSLEELSAHPALLKGIAAQTATAGISAPAATEDAPVVPLGGPNARTHSTPSALLPLYRFDYVNYRGYISTREVVPRYIYFGANQFHPEPQWLMKAYDPFKADERDFALCDMYPPSFIDMVQETLETTATYQEALMDDVRNQTGARSEVTDTLQGIMVRAVRALSKHFGFV